MWEWKCVYSDQQMWLAWPPSVWTCGSSLPTTHKNFSVGQTWAKLERHVCYLHLTFPYSSQLIPITIGHQFPLEIHDIQLKVTQIPFSDWLFIININWFVDINRYWLLYRLSSIIDLIDWLTVISAWFLRVRLNLFSCLLSHGMEKMNFEYQTEVHYFV